MTEICQPSIEKSFPRRVCVTTNILRFSLRRFARVRPYFLLITIARRPRVLRYFSRTRADRATRRAATEKTRGERVTCVTSSYVELLLCKPLLFCTSAAIRRKLLKRRKRKRKMWHTRLASRCVAYHVALPRYRIYTHIYICIRVRWSCNRGYRLYSE